MGVIKLNLQLVDTKNKNFSINIEKFSNYTEENY